MSKVRVCFLGTPEFAVVTLKALLADEHYEIVGVVTQPDRPAGRKLQLTPSPVKALALEQGLKVITPESLRKSPEAVAEIKSWGAEVAVVVAFGQILTEEFMSMFNFGAVNVHGSILPRWRGAAPIQRSIEAGDLESGVALQKMVKKLDAGDIIGIRKVKLDDQVDAMQLHDVLANLGAELLRVELMDYIRGNLVPVAQDESQVTYAKKIEKSESEIDWNLSAKQIDQKRRGFVYGPGVYTTLQGKKVKLHLTKVLSGTASGTPGTICKVTEGEILVNTGEGILAIIELQPESRNRMKVADFIKGHPLKQGDSFGIARI